MIINLKSELDILLPKAIEIYIATALIKKEGYHFFQDNLSADCLVNYLVGIDLPSCPEVLSLLMDSTKKKTTINGRIYHSKETYHPKVYILRLPGDKWIAFVGSANATSAGLNKNIEMSVKVEDNSQCQQMVNWFKDLYENGIELNEDFLKQYRKVYNRIRSRQAGISSY